ncbi:QWRF motif-containing protein 2 [Camellia lanceoleosa]|uniref:QWRF motif-containing protein 2 n=1 Tax=Camellia lanceoleosa TaxID=1840588 RepID=A0ACC0FQ92_9ERIC|nr:QWRF motif-containing protein 2 [Camellia lanceoleosa]
MSSPVRGSIRAASPSKLMTSVGSSPSRGTLSPSQVRNSVSSNFGETLSVLNFVVDVRRGKVWENRILDAHFLRLLYNRHLQWRFVNARTEATLLVQKHSAELSSCSSYTLYSSSSLMKNMWNAWMTISDLRDSITKKDTDSRFFEAKVEASLHSQGTSKICLWLHSFCNTESCCNLTL